jgi:hypothetical protein
LVVPEKVVVSRRAITTHPVESINATIASNQRGELSVAEEDRRADSDTLSAHLPITTRIGRGFHGFVSDALRPCCSIAPASRFFCR